MVRFDDSAEVSVLGSAMLDASCVPLIVAELTREHFAGRHRYVFDAIKRLHEADRPIDLVTLTNDLDEHSTLAAAGGAAVVSEYMSLTPTAANVAWYIEALQDTRRRAEFATGMRRAVSAAQGGDDDYLGMAREVVEAAEAHGSMEIPAVKDYSMQSIVDIGKKFDGIATGFADVDKCCRGGFRGGDLIILGARPSVGKTAFALNIAEHVAMCGKTVAVFEMEMAKETLVQRLAASVGRASLYDAERQDLEACDRLLRAAQEIEKWPLYIVDRAAQTFQQIKAAAYRIKQQRGLSLIIIDHLGLMSTSRRRDGTREQEIAELSRSFKGLAREMDCPVLVLSQLNRAIENRGKDSLPTLADLRESGAIEQDADIVMLMARALDSKTAKIVIAKNRNGKTGTLDFVWFCEYFTFRSAYTGGSQ